MRGEKTNTNRDQKGCHLHPFGPGWCYQPELKVLICPGCQTREKMTPFCPGLTVSVGKSGQQGFPNQNNATWVFCSSDLDPYYLVGGF